jgi:hypothetical protein
MRPKPPYPMFHALDCKGSDDSFARAILLTRRMILRKIRIALRQDGYLPAHAINDMKRSDPAWNQPSIQNRPLK